MSIDAMKQALEALRFALHVGFDESSESQIKKGDKAFRQHQDAITALRLAIEQADEQEAWKTSDMAYRPGGLPQDFVKHEVDTPGEWSEWVCPDPTQYFMKCCNCGLVHEMQFNIVKYSAGDKCEDFDDPYVQAVFRARRVEKAERQEPVADASAWWALVMGAAASIEDASNCLRDEDAKRQAIGAAKHYREKAQALYTTRQPMVVSQECAERGCMAHDDRVDGPGMVIERPWVGLTDEEIDKTYETQVWDARRSYARAIEAKLKEKNT